MRDRKTSLGCAQHAPQPGTHHHLGVCPDQRSNLRPGGVGTMPQPAEPPGRGSVWCPLELKADPPGEMTPGQLSLRPPPAPSPAAIGLRRSSQGHTRPRSGCGRPPRPRCFRVALQTCGPGPQGLLISCCHFHSPTEAPAAPEPPGSPADTAEPLAQCAAWLRAYFQQPSALRELPVPALHHPVFLQGQCPRWARPSGPRSLC